MQADDVPRGAELAAALRSYAAIAVVGATGAVGREALQQLAAAGLPAARVRPFASARSVGATVPYGDDDLAAAGLDSSAFVDGGLALLCADVATARQARALASGRDCALVDNSSAFRLDRDVPLVVPEVHGRRFAASRPRFVANPNCSTILLCVALAPLCRRFGLEEVVVATYQAVSGAGLPALAELRAETGRALAGEPPAPKVFRETCAFNVFSHDSDVDMATGRNVEEQKLIDETRRILGLPRLRVSPTCMRVPVERAHTAAVRVRLAAVAREAEVRAALASAPSVVLVDDRGRNAFPTPRLAAGRDEVLVGRIRPDAAEEPDADGRSATWSLLVCGDQLRKGAATNALQIAALLAAPAARAGPR
ncbi:MAG: aspartate-semialdehyde dehydrogenase [Planctomycetes bacterium]|nr:aspartate-semialdehyde dehydrogenase [Planctomycetota bacterium]